MKRISKQFIILRRQVMAHVWDELKSQFTMKEVAENIFKVDVALFHREINKAKIETIVVPN